MPKNVLPTMSSSGWVASLSEKANRLFAYYYTSQKSQTAIYGDEITSFQWTIQNCQGNLIKLKNDMTQSLEAYLRSYFDEAFIDIQLEEEPPNTGNISIRLYGTVQEDGQTHSFGKLLQQMDGIWKPIVDFNNTGSTTG